MLVAAMHTGPPPQGPPPSSVDPKGKAMKPLFTRTVRDYVFMCFAPSFLRSPGGAVTRIPESKHRRGLLDGSHRKRNGFARLGPRAGRAQPLKIIRSPLSFLCEPSWGL